MWEKNDQPTFFTQQFDRLVLENDKFRVIKQKVDFSFVDEIARPYYSDVGATGYRPERLFRCLLVMYLEGIRSERELEERLRYDIRYRYFCDLDIADPIPDHSTFSVFRSRLGAEAFCEIFDRLVEQVLAAGIATPSHVSVDSTSVLADCATQRRIVSGKGPDKDAAFGMRAGGKKTYFGYKAHTLVDSKHDVILAAEATPANIADLAGARRLLKKVRTRHKLTPKHLAADKAYGTIDFRQELKEQDITAVIPQRKGGKAGGFPKETFNFNSDGDLVCPAGRVMVVQARYSYKKRGLVEYAGKNCKTCELRPECTTTRRRKVTLSIFESEKRIHEQFQLTEEFKALYALRSSVERTNATMKQRHGLARAKFRCLWKVDYQVKMAAIANNLKKLVMWQANGPPEAKLA